MGGAIKEFCDHINKEEQSLQMQTVLQSIDVQLKLRFYLDLFCNVTVSFRFVSEIVNTDTEGGFIPFRLDLRTYVHCTIQFEQQSFLFAYIVHMRAVWALKYGIIFARIQSAWGKTECQIGTEKLYLCHSNI